jgi:NAD(P)-dependent dehydrogenase (short-subunit alcohol dehydrogenase family)
MAQTSLSASARARGDGALLGRTVVVVGGSSGIGLEVARQAKQAGADVAIAGRSAEKLEAAAHEIGGASMAVADIADEMAVARLFEGLGSVDHVFVSAGGLTAGPLVTADLRSFKQGVDERIWGNLHVIRAAAPKMSGGSITLMSGIRAERPAPGTSMTTALVAAVEGLTKALALELAPIRVNAVAPGWVDTPLVRGLLASNTDAVLSAEGAKLPVRRTGRPEDLGQAVLFLMTNGYMSGEILHVDGGGRLI